MLRRVTRASLRAETCDVRLPWRCGGKMLALHLVCRARAHVWMKVRVFDEHGVLMMQSFSLRDFLS
jgi:hypothetical protein